MVNKKYYQIYSKFTLGSNFWQEDIPKIIYGSYEECQKRVQHLIKRSPKTFKYRVEDVSISFK